MDVDRPDNEMARKQFDRGCTVLIVDDDPVCLSEYYDTIINLGYSVKCAADASDALKQIADCPEIGIIITDIEMPSMDGISLLSEIANRFSSHRPIVALVLTGPSNVQVATQAMRSQATDFLSKPISMEELAAALRRASAQQFAMANRFQITALTKHVNPPVAADGNVRRGTPPTGPELQIFVQMLLKLQHNKSKFFDAVILTGPSWEILLDITEGSLRGEAVPVSNTAISTQVPLSTALRHVNGLVEAGLVRRWTDPRDKRRTLLALEPHAMTAMQGYLETAWNLQASAR